MVFGVSKKENENRGRIFCTVESSQGREESFNVFIWGKGFHVDDLPRAQIKTKAGKQMMVSTIYHGCHVRGSYTEI